MDEDPLKNIGQKVKEDTRGGVCVHKGRSNINI
jgi:hypothetical protein